MTGRHPSTPDRSPGAQGESVGQAGKANHRTLRSAAGRQGEKVVLTLQFVVHETCQCLSLQHMPLPLPFEGAPEHSGIGAPENRRLQTSDSEKGGALPHDRRQRTDEFPLDDEILVEFPPVGSEKKKTQQAPFDKPRTIPTLSLLQKRFAFPTCTTTKQRHEGFQNSFVPLWSECGEKSTKVIHVRNGRTGIPPRGR